MRDDSVRVSLPFYLDYFLISYFGTTIPLCDRMSIFEDAYINL